jgi:hypothetical protein
MIRAYLSLWTLMAATLLPIVLVLALILFAR